MHGYDDWKTTDPRDTEPYAAGVPVGRMPPARGPCVICCDGGDGPPCSEGCRRVWERRLAKGEAARLRRAARLALKLLRAYRAEGDGMESPRLLATLARYGELRAELLVAQRKARGQS